MKTQKIGYLESICAGRMDSQQATIGWSGRRSIKPHKDKEVSKKQGELLEKAIEFIWNL